MRSLKAAGTGRVIATELARGRDFFSYKRLPDKRVTCIITNPPFRDAAKFVRHALTFRVPVAMLLRLQFLESAGRADILDPGSGLREVLVFAERLPMMHRDGWTGRRATSAMCFSWMIWYPDYHGPATVRRVSWRAIMPAVSKKQFKAMQAAAHGKSTLGIPKSVGKEYVEATPAPKKLPEKKRSSQRDRSDKA